MLARLSLSLVRSVAVSVARSFVRSFIRSYPDPDPNNKFRACVGRNLANMELLIIVASLFRRYHFVLEDPDKEVRVVSLSLSCVLGCLELSVYLIN